MKLKRCGCFWRAEWHDIVGEYPRESVLTMPADSGCCTLIQSSLIPDVLHWTGMCRPLLGCPEPWVYPWPFSVTRSPKMFPGELNGPNPGRATQQSRCRCARACRAAVTCVTVLGAGKGNHRGAGSQGGLHCWGCCPFLLRQRTFQMRSWEVCRRAGGSCACVTCLALLIVAGPSVCDLEIAVTVTSCVPLSHCQPLQLAVLGAGCAEGCQLGGFGAGLELFWGRQGAQSVGGGEGGVCRWERSLGDHRGS